MRAIAAMPPGHEMQTISTIAQGNIIMVPFSKKEGIIIFCIHLTVLATQIRYHHPTVWS
jgi:hypothetical protein